MRNREAGLARAHVEPSSLYTEKWNNLVHLSSDIVQKLKRFGKIWLISLLIVILYLETTQKI